MLDFQNYSAFYYLLLIPLVIGIYFYYSQWKNNTIRKIGNEHLVNNLFTSNKSIFTNAKKILRLATLLLLVIALANFRKGTENKQFEQSGRDLVVALDVSNSMLATDVQPNRLEKAKQFINHLIDSNANNRIGFVIFAGNAYISVPLTTDIGALKLNLQAINTQMAPTQGTAIGKAIEMAHACFNTKQTTSKAIILISDGEDHEEGINKAIDGCTDDNIQINTIGVGSQQGGNIIDPESKQIKTDDEGKEIVTKLQDEQLKTIADKSNGTYVLLNNSSEALNTITQSINQMEASSLGVGQFTNYNNYFQWFLLPALLLLFIEMILPKTRKNNFV